MNAVWPWLLALGLGFFFGLAFEEFYARVGQARPGGIRSFPLLALLGGALWRLDPDPPWLLAAGLLVLGSWLALYYGRHSGERDSEGQPNVGLVVPVCNLLAFLLGPLALAAPVFVPVGATVAAVMLLTARTELHALARRIELAEIVNAGRFLLITGLVLPLLPDRPVTTLSAITPHEAWLALVAVSAISYAGYLLRRYVVPAEAGLLTAVLGGLWSATATAVVLARAARAPAPPRGLGAGLLLANAIMYPRLLVVTALFDPGLAAWLAVPLLGLGLLGALPALGLWWWGKAGARDGATPPPGGNPLSLGTAAGFAALFVAVSLAVGLVLRRFGAPGLMVLAGLVGVTDINPFVLSLAQHGATGLSAPLRAEAVLLAAASNTVFQAIYAAAFSRLRVGAAPLAGLLALAAAGVTAGLALG